MKVGWLNFKACQSRVTWTDWWPLPQLTSGLDASRTSHRKFQVGPECICWHPPSQLPVEEEGLRHVPTLKQESTNSHPHPQCLTSCVEPRKVQCSTWLSSCKPIQNGWEVPPYHCLYVSWSAWGLQLSSAYCLHWSSSRHPTVGWHSKMDLPYVELTELRPAGTLNQEPEAQNCIIMPGLEITQANRKQIKDVIIWVQYFGVYIAALCQQHSSAIQEMLAYMLIIIRAAQEFEDPVWQSYDKVRILWKSSSHWK